MTCGLRPLRAQGINIGLDHRRNCGLVGAQGETAATAETARKPTVAAAGWRRIAAAVWQDLLNLVEIRAATVAEETRFDPAREALIKAGLQTEIITLRSALERRDTNAAHTSAAALTHTLNGNFEVNDPALAPLRAALVQLGDTDLAPPLPSLAASLRGLETLRQADVRVAPAPAEVPNEIPGTPTPMFELPSRDPREIM